MTAPLHIREVGSSRLNLCGEEGGQSAFPAAATCGMCRAVYADEVADRDPLTVDPDTSGWVPGPDLPATPVEPHRRGCCDRPSDEHPSGDPTYRGQCTGPHAPTVVSMHYDGRRYVCGLCALDAFHGGSA